MRKNITKVVLVILILALVTTGQAAAQSVAHDTLNPDGLSTSLSILLVGLLATLFIGTIFLNSPVALLAMAGSFGMFILAIIGVVSINVFYMAAGLHGLTLTATGVFVR